MVLMMTTPMFVIDVMIEIKIKLSKILEDTVDVLLMITRGDDDDTCVKNAMTSNGELCR